MMRVKWKVLSRKTLIWLAAEIILTFVGMDDLADYSEFLSVRGTFISQIETLS